MVSFETQMLHDVPDNASTIRRASLRPLEGKGSASDVRLAVIAPHELAAFDDRRRLRLAVSTSTGTAELEMPLRVVAPSGEGRWRLHGTAYLLTLELELDQDGSGRYRWTFEPGGRDAAGRARVLDFLIALEGDGVLTVTDAELS